MVGLGGGNAVTMPPGRFPVNTVKVAQRRCGSGFSRDEASQNAAASQRGRRLLPRGLFIFRGH